MEQKVVGVAQLVALSSSVRVFAAPATSAVPFAAVVGATAVHATYVAVAAAVVPFVAASAVALAAPEVSAVASAVQLPQQIVKPFFEPQFESVSPLAPDEPSTLQNCQIL